MDKTDKNVACNFKTGYKSPNRRQQTADMFAANVVQEGGKPDEYYEQMMKYELPNDEQDAENEKEDESLVETINKKYPILFGIGAGSAIFIIVGCTLFTFAYCSSSKK